MCLIICNESIHDIKSKRVYRIEDTNQERISVTQVGQDQNTQTLSGSQVNNLSRDVCECKPLDPKGV